MAVNPLIANAPASVTAEDEHDYGIGALLPILLLVACLGLGWVVYKQIMVTPVPRSPTVAPESTELVPKLPETQPFVMPPADDFLEVVDRPLFSPSRRLPSEVVPEVVVPKEPLDLELTGVIASDGHRTAILRPKAEAPVSRSRRSRRNRPAEPKPSRAAGGPSIQLSEGGEYKGWKLEQIEVDSALFVRGEEETRLEISFDVAAPAPPPQAKQPRQEATNRPPSDDADRDATSEERRLVMGALEKAGCGEADDVELEDGVFLADEVECDDGQIYEVTLDRNYKILDKDPD